MCIGIHNITVIKQWAHVNAIQNLKTSNIHVPVHLSYNQLDSILDYDTSTKSPSKIEDNIY